MPVLFFLSRSLDVSERTRISELKGKERRDTAQLPGHILPLLALAVFFLAYPNLGRKRGV